MEENFKTCIWEDLISYVSEKVKGNNNASCMWEYKYQTQSLGNSYVMLRISFK